MRRGINYVCCAMMAFFAIMAPGCDNDDQELIIGGDEEVGTVTFKSIGIAFSSDNKGVKMCAGIGPSGGSFTIIPDEKYSDVGYVTRVWIDGEVQQKEGDFSGEGPYLEYIPILSGEWGGFVHKIEDGQRIIEVTVNENTSPEKRRIEFLIGQRLTYVWCSVMQEGAR